MIDVAKGHAYGNDFLYVPASQVGSRDASALARAMCDRHCGIGADGLILYDESAAVAVMRLYNADGSAAEVSGNGVRGLAALLVMTTVTRGARGRSDTAGSTVTIATVAGEKRLTLLETAPGGRYLFRAAMGAPADIRSVTLHLGTTTVDAIALSMGNPQCIVLEPALSPERLHTLGPQIEGHTAFPDRTNVAFVHVERPDRLRILIWERGVGPTQSSGTGSCASAVAAAAYGGATRDVEVIAPGGAQRVEWLDDGVYLTGWAQIVMQGRWVPA